MDTKTKIIIGIGSFLGIGTFMSSIAWINGKINDAKREEEERIQRERRRQELNEMYKKVSENQEKLTEKLTELAFQSRIEAAAEAIKNGNVKVFVEES